MLIRTDTTVRQMARKIFALPLLPPRDMVVGFNIIQENFQSSFPDEKVQKFVEYVKKTWFSSSVWKPQDISAYQRLVRTNNDLEGYHRRLNARINKDHPSVFSLLEVLYKESQLVNLTAMLVPSNTVKMQRQRKTQERQGKLEELWLEYDSGTLPMEEFLLEAATFTSAVN